MSDVAWVSRNPAARSGALARPGYITNYLRTVSNLPWHVSYMMLEIHARRFFYDEGSCERRIFLEGPPPTAAGARKISRLKKTFLAIVFELGGRAGAGLATKLGLVAGRDTLFARARNATLSEVGKVKALSMDDLAFKNGNAYGTILPELERHSMADRPEFHLKTGQDARRLLEADLEFCPAETRSERHEVLQRVLGWSG